MTMFFCFVLMRSSPPHSSGHSFYLISFVFKVESSKDVIKKRKKYLCLTPLIQPDIRKLNSFHSLHVTEILLINQKILYK